MKNLMKGVLGVLALGVIAPMVSAQIVALPLISWKYQQPWTKPWHSFASVVQSCEGNPVQFAPVCFDDWICTSTGPIVRVNWWGTSPQSAQVPNRPFYIAIYSDQQCRPAQLLYKTCVFATNQPVSVDCRQRRVYRFSANLPTGAAGFSQVAGTHYWLQISEIDGSTAGSNFQSPTLGAVDFQWSAHRPIRNCPAARRNISGVWQQPLLDACDQIEEDLSFVLYRKAIIGTINWPVLNPALPAPSFTAEFRNAAGDIVARETFCPDDDGSFALTPEIPDGDYECVIRGMCLLPASFAVSYTEATDFVDLGAINVGAGDVNGDGRTNFTDISMLLSGWAP